MPTDPSAAQTLAEQAHVIHAALQTSDGRLKASPDITAILLAHFFFEQVERGGFAQLIYNAQGENLQQIEQMLRDAPAPEALRFFVQAIRMCFEDKLTYHQFISNPYMDHNDLKERLHMLSMQYAFNATWFDEEAEQFLQATPARVAAWMAGSTPDAAA